MCNITTEFFYLQISAIVRHWKTQKNDVVDWRRLEFYKFQMSGIW